MDNAPGHLHQRPAGTVRPEDLYASTPPWDIGRPQPAFLALAGAGAITGRVLDAGCGTGEHTLMAAALGLDATGVDLATNALHVAEEKARERGLTARFAPHDARDLPGLGELFDTVLDCGLFHLFRGADRAAYVRGVRSVLVPGGRYLMLGLRDDQPDPRWPHQLGRADITAAFAEGWRLDTVEPTTMDVTVEPDRVPAWLVTATRIGA
ncbi:MAG: class I SAM-dependent methyltransferase [Mycobacteriales bacterium]